MRRLSFVLCLVGLLASVPAFAQNTTGNIVGSVTDNTGAVLPGVTVTLTGEFAAGTFTSITTARGFYFFNRLHPGSYELVFTMDGFASNTRSGVTVTLGGTTDQNVALSVGSVSEQLTVTADALVLDVTDSGLSNAYDNQMVENLPLRRSFYNLMEAAPGITSVSESGALMSTGGETDANAFKMDGVAINSRSQGRTWLDPNPDIVAEVEILALGAPAEYGQVTGAVFNVVTKQGSNRFHGAANYYYTSDGMTGRNTDDDFDNGHPISVDDHRDFSLSLGGPIVKDKLWFFGSYRNWLASGTGAGTPAEFPNTSKNWTIFGKLNFQINPSHKIQAAFHQDNYSYGSNAGPDLSQSWLSREYGKTPAPSFSYTGILASNTMLEVRAGGFYGRDHYGPQDESQRRDGPWYYNYAYGGDCQTGPCLYTGGPDYWYDLDEVSTTINASLSHYVDEFLGGSHDFKFGIQYQRAGREDAIVGYTDSFYLYLDGNGDEYVFGTDYSPFSYGGIGISKSVFVDDTFRVNDRVTLNLGLRFDNERASVPELAVLERDGTPTGEIVPAVDDLYTLHQFAPRLGFTYRLTEDGRTLLRGHYGRYNRGVVTMDFAGGPGNIGTTDFFIFQGYYDPAGFHAETLEGDGRGINQGRGPDSNASIDPNYGSTYTDQFVLGVERELSSSLGLSLTYTHKRGNNFPGWVNDGTYEPFEYTDPNSGITNTFLTLTSDPEQLNYLLTSNPDLDTRVNAGVVALTKRMADNWQLTSSLQLLRNSGHLASQKTQNGHARQDGGVAWRNFGYSANDYINTGGRLIGDMPVTFKTQLLVELPAAFLAGLNYTYASGGTWSRTARVNTGPLTGRETLLLEDKDGSLRIDNRSILDLRLQKTFHLTSEARLVLIADGFNVFNSGAGQRIRSTSTASSSLGLPRNIVQPRRLQLGAKLQF